MDASDDFEEFEVFETRSEPASEGVDVVGDRPIGSQGMAQTSATARAYDDTDVAAAGSDDGAGAGMVQEARSTRAGGAETRGDGAPGAPSRQEGPGGPKKRRRARSSGSKHVARNLRKLAAFNSAHEADAATSQPEGDHTHGGT